MAIRAIRLQNFMAFGEYDDANEGWLELRPITLLFGRNSSGKSTIFRAIRMLQQSLTFRPEGSLFAYSVTDGVDVGSFREMLHKKEINRSIRFEFRMDVDLIDLVRLLEYKENELIEPCLEITFSFYLLNEIPTLQSFEMHLRQDLDATERELLLSMEYDYFGNEVPFWYTHGTLAIMGDKGDGKNNIWDNIEVKFQPPLSLTLIYPMEPDDLKVLSEDFMVNKWLKKFNEEINSFLQSIVHIAPLRPEPKRLYVLDSDDQQRWQRLNRSGFLRMLRLSLDREIITKLETALDLVEVADTIALASKLDEPSAAAIVSELKLQGQSAGVVLIDLVDMGFGISQVLPMIVECLLADENSVIAIEQPELHLHPGAQAKLADFFIEVAKEKGARFMIETHSEHLFLRLRRRVAETSRGWCNKGATGYLEHINLGAYYVDRQLGVSTIEPILVNERGEVHSKGFRGFFADDLYETSAWMKARFGDEFEDEDEE